VKFLQETPFCIPLRLANYLVIVLAFMLSASYLPSVCAQSPESIPELKRQAEELLRKTNYVDALPLLEKIVVAEPDNAKMQFYLGSALIAQANTQKDSSVRKGLRIRARQAFIRARELGNTEPLLEAIIQSLPPDGSERGVFSENIEANALMLEAEGFFGQGKLDQALENYQKALQLDPKIYDAALFSGDVFMQQKDFAQAEIWYQKAIAINPNRETAYRYSATPLMKQNKVEAARDRYIEALIVEPYNRFARGGLIQWAQVTKTPIAHPKIDIPTEVTFDDKGNATVNLDSTALSGKDDGSFAWVSYGITRSLWRKEKFAKTFPKEKAYRHSLPEEAEALRSVISLATTDKKTKTLNPSLAKLKQLNDEGLLEAFILLALVDEGIAVDHPVYLSQSRDKLRRYVIDYVVNSRGE
jgi:tetratricopeptide (TPR) repeat protein